MTGGPRRANPTRITCGETTRRARAACEGDGMNPTMTRTVTLLSLILYIAVISVAPPPASAAPSAGETAATALRRVPSAGRTTGLGSLVGRHSPKAHIAVDISLSLRDRPGLQGLITGLSDPTSLNYG